MSPPPEVGTSQEELLGTTTGIILTVIVAVIGLAVLLIPMFWAAGHPNTRRPAARQRPGKIHGAVQTDDPRSVTRRRDDNREGDVAGSAGDAGGQGHWPSERLEDRHVPEGGNPHGKPSSWALVAAVTAAFITGGLAIITHTWWLLWACSGIVVLAIPAGKAIGIMDDTVAWGSNPAATHDPPQDPEADPGRD
jgi:hypothetical protein